MIPLSLYIHWPFCKSKCPYCDFNSHVRDSINEAAWQDALLRELDYWAAQTQGRRLASIFFGGGTPSLMPPATTGALIARAKQVWSASDDLEVTLEANPTSVEASKLRDFKAAGVNRLSMGVQSLNDADLKSLGRQHSAGEAMAAIETATSIFERFSFDLIYARMGQTVEQWQAELKQALRFKPRHLSVYQLTIEPGTQFHTLHQRGELVTPDEELGSALYEVTQDILEEAGMPAYEISNHAVPGQECRHNLTYWRYEDYVGIGPGAHGRATVNGTKLATRTHRAPEEWLERTLRDGHGLTEQTPVPAAEQKDEMLLMGLRLSEGIARKKLDEYGIRLNPAKLATLTRHGLIKLDDEKLVATREGRLRLNALIAELAD